MLLSLLRPRWHKVITDLWSNKIRSLLVVLSISTGVFAAGMIISVYGMMTEDMRSSYEQINPANIYINAPDFDQDFVKSIRRLPEISEAQAERKFSLRMRVPANTPNGQDSWININIIAIPDISIASINQPGLLEGTWPPKDKEIVFDQHKWIESRAAVGNTVEIKLSDGKIKQVPVVGLVHDLSIGATGGGGYFPVDLTGYVTFNTLEWLGQPEKANLLLARTAENDNDSTYLFNTAQVISNKFEDSGIKISNFAVRQTNDHPSAVYIQAISGVLLLLGFLVVFLSAFLIINTLSALLNQQMEQIGIIKTLGGQTRQIMIIYMVTILVYSAIALALALMFSGHAAYWLLSYLAREVNFNIQGYREVPASLIVQIIIAFIVPQAAGFFPIYRGSKISVKEAFNGPQTDKKSKTNAHFAWRVIENVRGVSRPLIISLRNTFRRKTRLLLTLITLTLGGAIFIATFNVQASMSDFIVRLSNYFSADVTLDFSQPYHIQKIEALLEDQPNVSNVEGWAGAKAEILLAGDKPADSVNLLAPPVDSKLIQPIMIEGRWLVKDDENALVLNDNFKSRLPDLKLGDTLRLSIYGEKVNWVVVGFFQFAGKSSGLIGYANYDYLSRITHTPLKAASYQILSSESGLSLDQQAAQGRQLEILVDQLGYHVSGISSGQDMLSSATSGLNMLIIVLLIMALLAATVGSIGLTGTLSMNVMDRTREIAVMRAIGASDKAVMRLVIVEGLTIGLMSWIFGSLLAFPISEMMWNIISKSLFDVSSNFSFNFVGFVLWMFVVLVLSTIASVVPAHNAAKLTIREALAYE